MLAFFLANMHSDRPVAIVPSSVVWLKLTFLLVIAALLVGPMSIDGLINHKCNCLRYYSLSYCLSSFNIYRLS